MDAIITLEGKPFGLLSSDLSLIAPVVRLERWDENIWDGKYLSYYTNRSKYLCRQICEILLDYLVKDDNILNNNKFNAIVQINY